MARSLVDLEGVMKRIGFGPPGEAFSMLSYAAVAALS
jgi:hypothetical protein